jgi:hypothetical protein
VPIVRLPGEEKDVIDGPLIIGTLPIFAGENASIGIDQKVGGRGEAAAGWMEWQYPAVVHAIRR